MPPRRILGPLVLAAMPERKTPAAGEIDVGYLAGRVDAQGEELHLVREDQRRMWERLDWQAQTLVRVEHGQASNAAEILAMRSDLAASRAEQASANGLLLELKGILEKQASTDKYRALRDPPSGLIAFITHPATVYAFAATLVVVGLIAMLLLVSGRPATDLNPLHPPAAGTK